MSTALTVYETQQLEEIKDWKEEEPSVISKAFDVATTPINWAMNKIIPEVSIQAALHFSSVTAEWLTDTADIIKKAQVEKIDDLKCRDLELSDDMANIVHNWAISLATAGGGVTGAAGLAGMAVDIPSVIVLALRTVHKIGVCYGYECTGEKDREFALAILASSSANNMADKIAALTTLRTIEVTLAKQTWKVMAQKAASDKMSKEAAIIGVKNLAKQLGVNLTKRKALQVIPAIGAFVGGSVNGWYLKDVGWAARRAFQERWLVDSGKMI